MGDDYYEDEAIECYFEIIGHFFFKFWVAFFKQTKSDFKSGKTKVNKRHIVKSLLNESDSAKKPYEFDLNDLGDN